MDRQYYKQYRTKSLNHHALQLNIESLFKDKKTRQLSNFDEILYILDQRCENGRSNRDICRELFDQAQNKHYKTSLSSLIERYIENLETSKLCLLRDEGRLQQLKLKTDSQKDREKAFVYLKIIQVSVFSKFTKDTTLEYKIEPTDIPSVKLNKAMNYTLNHEFVLEMEESEFDIVFYESGIEIYRWTFPDQPNLPQGEYTRLVESDNVSFEAKLKYLPKGKQKDTQLLETQIRNLQKQLEMEKKAFYQLCSYVPFQEGSSIRKGQNQQKEGSNCREKIVNCIPCLKYYVIVLFWMSTLQVLLQCWASIDWPSQFPDIMLTLYLLGVLNCRLRKTYNFDFLMIMIGYFLLSIKTAWEAYSCPRPQQKHHGIISLLVCCVGKLILILLLFISRGHEEQTRSQCDSYILGLVSKPQLDLHKNQVLHQSIYEP